MMEIVWLGQPGYKPHFSHGDGDDDEDGSAESRVTIAKVFELSTVSLLIPVKSEYIVSMMLCACRLRDCESMVKNCEHTHLLQEVEERTSIMFSLGNPTPLPEP